MDGKNILLITSWFNRSRDNPNLINDLAAQLGRDGHHVTVIAVDWHGGPDGEDAHYVDDDGVEVVFIRPEQIATRTLLRRARKFVTTSFRALRKARPHLEGRRFDLLLAIAPLTNQLAPVLWAQRRFKCRSYVYVTDFFPHHHRQIGVVPGGAVYRVALAVETMLLRSFDVIGCMSPANAKYLRRHYRLRDEQRVEILPLWGPIDAPETDVAAVRAKYDLPVERKIVVYGGQLSEGRGFDEILAAARLASAARPDLFFLIIGSGPLEGQIAEAVAQGQSNIMLRTRIAREDYLALLAACDIGLVCTVPGVDVPSFPSKTIDLLRAAIPVVASVETTTDYGDFVREHGFGIAIEAGSPERMLAAIARIVDRPDEAATMRAAGRRTLETVFDVSKVGSRLIAQSFPEESRPS